MRNHPRVTSVGTIGRVVNLPVWFRNLKRRHFNESQRAMVAAKLANMPQGARTDIQPSANLPNVISQPQAAKLLNVSPRSLRDAKTILQEGYHLAEEVVFLCLFVSKEVQRFFLTSSLKGLL